MATRETLRIDRGVGKHPSIQSEQERVENPLPTWIKGNQQSKTRKNGQSSDYDRIVYSKDKGVELTMALVCLLITLSDHSGSLPLAGTKCALLAPTNRHPNRPRLPSPPALSCSVSTLPVTFFSLLHGITASLISLKLLTPLNALAPLSRDLPLHLLPSVSMLVGSEATDPCRDGMDAESRRSRCC